MLSSLAGVTRVTLQVQKFSVESEAQVEITTENEEGEVVKSEILETFQTIVLLANDIEQPYSYDSITGSTTRVIAAHSNRNAIGSYHYTNDKFNETEIATTALTNRSLTFQLCQIRGLDTAIYEPLNRIWYAIINITYHRD